MLIKKISFFNFQYVKRTLLQSRNQEINETQLKVHVMQLIGQHTIHRKFTRLPSVAKFTTAPMAATRTQQQFQ